MKYGELNRALLLYTNSDIHKNIPDTYYHRIMKAWFKANNKGLSWDVQQAAAILLYIAFNESVIHPSQLNGLGLKTLDWAEKFLEQVQHDSSKEVIKIRNIA